MTSIYLIEDEWATELANRTAHSGIHIGWVPDRTGGYRGQMAGVVKPNGFSEAPIWPRSGRSTPDRGSGHDSNDRTGLASAGTDRRRREADRDQGSNVIVSG